jgi:hypothetical protein
MMAAHTAGVKISGQRIVSTQKLSQPNRVPIVPGMMGDKPLPNPSEIQCTGWDSMKATLGRRIGMR